MNDIELIGAAELIGVLDTAATQILPLAHAITEQAGEHLRQQWVDNATESSGVHGRFYPKAITAETVPAFMAAVVDVGPETGRKQGGMGPGFEYGSVNQPPHLDGKRAADATEASYASQMELMVAGLL